MSEESELQPAYYKPFGKLWELDTKASGYRLAKKDEWEFAARGGSKGLSTYYAGSNEMEKVGWFAWDSELMTHPVGEKKPNELVIIVMSGNVWELVMEL
ncbi:MAG: SUMF1/EgtB/PvdO family nonheme iron enzyme [bacterium]